MASLVSIWGLVALVGLIVLALSALGSDVGIDLGLDGGFPGMGVVLGTMAAICGASGIVSKSMNVDNVAMTVIIVVSTIVAGAIAYALVRFFVKTSSDGNESSIKTLIGTTFVASESASDGALARTRVNFGEPPRSLYVYYRADGEVKAGDMFRITGVSNDSALEVMVERVS